MENNEIIASVSLTETVQFRRLVDFLGDVQAHASETDDYELLAMVEECRTDLTHAFGKMAED